MFLCFLSICQMRISASPIKSVLAKCRSGHTEAGLKRNRTRKAWEEHSANFLTPDQLVFPAYKNLPARNHMQICQCSQWSKAKRKKIPMDVLKWHHSLSLQKEKVTVCPQKDHAHSGLNSLRTSVDFLWVKPVVQSRQAVKTPPVSFQHTAQSSGSWMKRLSFYQSCWARYMCFFVLLVWKELGHNKSHTPEQWLAVKCQCQTFCAPSFRSCSPSPHPEHTISAPPDEEMLI